MDGVERVMVLGILAVIVAILSFAWGADDDSEPLGAVDGGASGVSVPLSSSVPNAPGVVVSPFTPAGNRTTTPGAVQEARRQQMRSLLDRTGSLAKTGQLPAANPESEPAAAGPASPTESARQPAEPLAPRETATGEPEPRVATGPAAATPLTPPPKPVVPEEAGFRRYTVRSGDTLWQIAYREVDQGDTQRIVEIIQELNPTIDASRLAIGQTIKVPLANVLPPGVGSRALEKRAQEHDARIYLVEAGDTLRGIASAELGDAKRWEEIYRLNRSMIERPEQIPVGLSLLLPKR